MKPIVVVPSILAADLRRLGEKVAAVDQAGADHLLIHTEPSSTANLLGALLRIRDFGKKASVVLDPTIPAAFIEPVLRLCDFILVMGVSPGFGGQAFQPEILPKIQELHGLCVSKQIYPWIEVDGGQNCENAARVVAAGANTIVAGSAIFHSGDYAAAIAQIRNASVQQKVGAS